MQRSTILQNFTLKEIKHKVSKETPISDVKYGIKNQQ
jgi:hypothetical protein